MKTIWHVFAVASVICTGCSKEIEKTDTNRTAAKSASRQPKKSRTSALGLEQRKPPPNVRSGKVASKRKKQPTQIKKYKVECAEDRGRGRTIIADRDGAMAAFLTKTSDVHFFDIATGTVKGRLGIDNAGGVDLIALSANGAKLATIRRTQGEITIWDVKSRQRLQTINRRNLHAVAFSLKGEQLGIADADGVEVWKLVEGHFAKQGSMPVKGRPRRPRQLLFSPANSYLAVMPRFDGRPLELWNLATNAVVEFPLNNGPRDRAMAFNSDGTLIAYVDDNPIKIRDVAKSTTGVELIHKLNRSGSVKKSHINGTKTVAFSRDNRTLASSGQSLDGIKFWDSASGKLKFQFARQLADQIVFRPDGAVLTVTRSGEIGVWNLPPSK